MKAKITKLRTIEKALPKNYEEFEKDLEVYKENALEELEDFDFEGFEGNLQAHISNKFFCTCDYLKKRKGQELTKDDYEIGFNAFYEILNKLNERTVYNATTFTFAQFMGIAVDTLKKHADQNNERGNTVRFILDRLTENHLQTMQGDRINAVTGIFIAKAVHRLKDNETPNVNILNINASQKSVEDIMLEYQNSKGA